jgi:alpha-beta hydrolase superfamily lysophospholipase
MPSAPTPPPSTPPADATAITGVVVLAHGLNNRPAVMGGLAEVLAAEGFHCVSVALPHDLGRRGSPDEIVDRWVGAVAAGHAIAVGHAGGLPVHHLGFSLGALVAVEFLRRAPEADVRRMVLLAPPVALTAAARLVRILVPLRRVGAVIPSATPKAVRSRWGTPLSEYAAMLALSASVRRQDARTDRQPVRALDGVQTLVVVDRDDELVDHRGVIDWARATGRDGWTVVHLPSAARGWGSRAHLVAHEPHAGPARWAALTATVLDHLCADP